MGTEVVSENKTSPTEGAEGDGDGGEDGDVHGEDEGATQSVPPASTQSPRPGSQEPTSGDSGHAKPNLPPPYGRLLLRLDNGSLLGVASKLLPDEGEAEAGAVLLPAERALSLGRLGQADVKRLEDILAVASGANGLLGKREGDTRRTPADDGRTAPEANGHPIKKPRSLASPVGNGLHPSPPSGTRSSGQKSAQDVSAKLREILHKVYDDLGDHKNVFYLAVDPNFVPDYYTIVKTPRTLQQMEDKVEEGQYSDPQEFAEDMRLVWANCKLYNPKDDPFRKIGERAEGVFEQAWAASGLSHDSRVKRTTAGLHAAKFDPIQYDPGPPTKGKSAKHHRTSKRQIPGDDLERTKSFEVTSQKGARRIPQDQLIDIANALQALEDQTLLAGALEVINSEAKMTDEEGEIEIEFDRLSYDSFLELKKYLHNIASRSQPGQSGHRSPVSAQQRRGSVRLDQSSSSDEETSYDSDV